MACKIWRVGGCRIEEKEERRDREDFVLQVLCCIGCITTNNDTIASRHSGRETSGLGAQWSQNR